ncbi:hypothetical protein BB559_000892 [Furculomyces boomerangus]|uniref:Uncharacterized protein n=2 Tax=Harpellales TaxID=61421 RepID=A0A2T9Z3Q9_9FUNG|nr:hypothetical protein BB559_000892 [Furculomyces boomerangus]PWA02085.1 hypothetical protein BB558_001786 [Smittium angustum]
MKFLSIIFSLVVLAVSTVYGLNMGSTDISAEDLSRFPKNVAEFGPQVDGLEYTRRPLAIRPGDLVPIEFNYNRASSFKPRSFHAALYSTSDGSFVKALGGINFNQMEGFGGKDSRFAYYVPFHENADTFRIYNIAMFASDAGNSNFRFAGRGLISYDPGH